MKKLSIKTDKEYRSVELIKRSTDPEDNYIVEGYATTFDSYVLFEVDGVEYHEAINRSAFEGTDMSDVIMQYDHEGRVLARTTNGTLKLSIDNQGIYVKADLSKSGYGRELYNDIKKGLVTKMSWAFKVADEEFDRPTRTRVIKRIKKIYDVSAVSIPANDFTSINAQGQNQTNANTITAQRKKDVLRLKIKMFEMELEEDKYKNWEVI